MLSKTNGREDSEANQLTVDALFDVFTDLRCRTVLAHLARESSAAELSELTSRLDEDGDSDRLVAQLHHVILPKLDDVGLVSYDWENNVARLEAPAQRVSDCLHRTRRYRYRVS
ncbi:hypothetical protein BRC82_08710 [Halobacteriales archaeon QS_1_67_19]|nr:MAG: hypothetical protein BRC82_08710 [Halobacteriales archaeon QS_1_67_19]